LEVIKLTLKVHEECDGRGYMPNPDMDTRDPDSPDHIKCEDCDGEGFIEDDE
jgi:hypothetical protein